jgi:ribosomal protein S18 acetylase RimI-like enzyme
MSTFQEIIPRACCGESDIALIKTLVLTGRAVSRHCGYIHPGDVDWRLYYHTEQEAWSKSIYLWENQNGKLTAFALINDLWFESYVLPQLRGTAYQYAVFDWCESHLRNQISASESKSGMLRSYAFDDDLDWISFLTGRGYAAAEHGFVYMMRSLKGSLPEISIPDGFTLRGITGPEDVEQRAAVHISAFKSKKMTVEHYHRFMTAPGYKPELDSVCMASNGQFVAFAMGWLDEHNRIGEFEPVGTHQDFQRRGLGKAVILRGLRSMQEYGMQEAIVYTHDDNPAAIALYESAGFKAITGFRDYICEFRDDSP